MNTLLCIQNLHDSSCCYTCSGEHDGHHGNHQERHDDLHRILDKRHHIAHLNISHIYAVSSRINNQNADTIHNQHHHRHHESHCPVYEQVRFCQSVIRFLKPLLLVFFPAECPDHRNTRQNLTAYQIQPINQCLQRFKLRHCHGKKYDHHTKNQGNCHTQNPRHGRFRL